MLVQKSEHVIGPDGGSKIAESMTILNRGAVRRIHLHFVRLAGILHRRGEGLARREIVVVRGLEKENRRLRISNRAHHQCLQLGCLRPALGAARRIDGRTETASLRAEHRLDAAKRISSNGDAIGSKPQAARMSWIGSTPASAGATNCCHSALPRSCARSIPITASASAGR